jgi:poly-gamma-glutamate capsule biosynthesis protein CapA/YwtB (metallophosphatase superfamily)
MLKGRARPERTHGARKTAADGSGPWMRAAAFPCVTLLMAAACWAAPAADPSAAPGTAESAIRGSGIPASPSPRAGTGPPVRLAFIGDVMLGRGVADVAASDPGSIFENLRPALADADLAFANLESPLTSRPHATAGYALEADPAAARLLAGAGLDVVVLANNHATDAGPATVLDTIAATDAAGLRSVGAGADASAAEAPLVLDMGGVRVGILAFDMTGGGTPATAASPGVSTWNRAAARAAVGSLRPDVDLLVVAIHGGVEYLPRPDPVLQQAVDDLAAWGADVTWGHGAHVPYPVGVAGASRPAVAAPGLGNAVFDQRFPGTDEGTLLEVLADEDGVLALRTGTIGIEAGRAALTGWHEPAGDAVAIGAEWWTPVRALEEAPAGRCGGFDLDRITTGLQAGSRVMALDCGSVTATGAAEIAIAYRAPLEPRLLQGVYADHRWADAGGRSAHLAVMAPDAHMVWAAGTLPDPIGTVAVCSGSLAVGYTTLDDPAVTAAGAWTWRGFGFVTAPALSHPTTIGCADVDQDGATEPFVHRSVPTPGGTSP